MASDDAVRERVTSEESRLRASRWGRLRGMAGAAWAARVLRRRPEDMNAEDLVVLVGSLGQMKGLAMKAGQLLSYIDVSLPEEARRALAILQTRSASMPIERVRALVAEELGDRGRGLADSLSADPIAAASIGQVHRAVLPSGEQVAVKVQYPEIFQAIESDFSLAGVGPTFAGLIYPGSNIEGFLEEAKARLREECDYLHEAEAQEEFRRLFLADATVVVPQVFREYSSSRVLTSAWVDGQSLDDYLASAPAQSQRDRLGIGLFRFYVGTLFEQGIYNCDPHPGNYLFTWDGRIAILDYGCTRRFERAFIEKLAGLTVAVHADDESALRASFQEIGFGAGGRPYDFATARDLVRSFYGPMLKDAVIGIDLGDAIAMRDVFGKKRELMKLNLPAEFLFLLRIRFGLMAVLARLGARANWHALDSQFAASALQASRSAP